MNLKTLNLTVLLLTILVLVPTIQIVYASPLSTFYLSGGKYPQGSCVVWKEGTNYYTKNAYGSHFPSSGNTNASLVINEGLASGGTVYLTEAFYYIDSPIIISQNGTHLTGDKNAYIWQSDGANIDYMIQVSQYLHYIRISDFWIEGNGDNNVGSSALIVREHCWYVTIDHMHILHWDIYGIYVKGYTGVIDIHSNYVTSTQHEDVSSGIFTSGMADSDIYFNEIAGGNHSCLRMHSGGYNRIIGNKLFATQKYYMYFDCLRETVIDGNVIGGGSPFGEDHVILLKGYGSASNYGNIISNNIIYGSQYAIDAIRLHGELGNNTIIGNYFMEGGFTQHGIAEIDSCNFNLIIGNNFPTGTSLSLIGANTSAVHNIGASDYP